MVKIKTTKRTKIIRKITSIIGDISISNLI
jgi:hypothetical protein